MYAILLFRLPSSKEVESHVSNGPANESINNFISRKAMSIISSSEKTKKANKNPFQYFDIMNKADLKDLNHLLDQYLDKTNDAENFFYVEVKALLGEVEVDQACEIYAQLSQVKNNNISQISKARLIKYKSKNEDEFSLEKRKFIQQYEKKMSSAELFQKEQDMTESAVTLSQLRRFRSDMLRSSDVMSDALGDYIIDSYEKHTSKELIDIFSSALILKNFSKLDIEILADYLKKILELKITKQTDSKINLPVIITGGFLFSGSSAIYDYFRTFSGVSVIEMGQKEVENPLVGAYYRATKANTDRQSVLDFYLKYLLNLFTPKNHDHLNLKRPTFSFFERSRFGLSPIDLSTYIEHLDVLISGVLSNEITVQRQALSLFLKGFSSSINNQPEFLLLNQSPSIMGIQAINALPLDSKCVVVYRDPRDQFVDQVNHGALNFGKYRDVNGFIEKFRADRLSYLAKKENECNSYHFVETYFEDFILSESERRRVCNELNLSFENSTRFFNPEVSKKNIGIYKDWHNQSDILAIESELKDYFWGS